jgi:hypothetical protein
MVSVTPYCSGNWRHDAHHQTLAEVPVLPKTGFEIGDEPTLHGVTLAPNCPRHMLSKLQDNHGFWLSSIDIRHQLEQDNPVLARTAILCNASGRYSVDIQVVFQKSLSYLDALSCAWGVTRERRYLVGPPSPQVCAWRLCRRRILIPSYKGKVRSTKSSSWRAYGPMTGKAATPRKCLKSYMKCYHILKQSLPRVGLHRTTMALFLHPSWRTWPQRSIA